MYKNESNNKLICTQYSISTQQLLGQEKNRTKSYKTRPVTTTQQTTDTHDHAN